MSLEKIIIKSKDFDPTKLTFGEVKTMKDIGAQFAPVTYEGKKLFMQTPEMLVPFGMSQFKSKEGDEKKETENASWTVDLSFAGEDETPEIKNLHDRLDQVVDKILLDNAFNNVWIKDKKARGKGGSKSVTKAVLEQLISPQVKYSDSEKSKDPDGNPKYAPTMKVKVPCYNGVFACEAYDENSKPITDRPLNEVLIKGTRAKCLLECGAVFLGNKISLTWKLNQVKIRQTARMSGYSFIDSEGEGSDGESNGDDDDNDDDNDVDTKKTVDTTSKPVKPVKTDKPIMIDSDAESEEESEEESDEE